MDDILQVGVYINTIVSIQKKKKKQHNMHNTMSFVSKYGYSSTKIAGVN